MPLKANKAGIWRTIWGLLEENNSKPDTNPDISDAIQQSMSRDFGLDNTMNLWREVTVDSNGRQRVTMGPDGGAIKQVLQPNLTAFAETLVFDTNPTRQYIYGESQIVSEMYVTFRVGDYALGNFLIWPNDTYMWLDGYIGKVYLTTTVSGLFTVLVEV